jgi:hypothetical protein
MSGLNTNTLVVDAGLGITYDDTILGYYPAQRSVGLSGLTFNNVDPSHLLVWTRQTSVTADEQTRVFWSGTEPYTQAVPTHTRFAWDVVIQSDSNPSPQANWLEIGYIGINTTGPTITAINVRDPDYFPSGATDTDKRSLTDFAYYHRLTSPIDHPDSSITSEKFETDALIVDKRPVKPYWYLNAYGGGYADQSAGCIGPIPWPLPNGGHVTQTLIRAEKPSGTPYSNCYIRVYDSGLYLVTICVMIQLNASAAYQFWVYLGYRNENGTHTRVGPMQEVWVYFNDNAPGRTFGYIPVSLTEIVYLDSTKYYGVIVDTATTSNPIRIVDRSVTSFMGRWLGSGDGRL